MSQPEKYYQFVQQILSLTPLKRTWGSICSDLVRK